MDRILGSKCSIALYTLTGPLAFGEVDKFNAEPETEMKKFHPLGQVEPHAQLVYGGYKLSFSGGKVNSDWANVQDLVDKALLAGTQTPRFRVVQTTVLYDGTVETYTYDNCLIYGLKVDQSNAEDQIGQDLSGWAPKRTSGAPASTTTPAT